MSWTLLILAIGGYGGDSPALSSVDLQSFDACMRAGSAAVSVFKTKVAAPFSDEKTQWGARDIKFICIRKTTGDQEP